MESKKPTGAAAVASRGRWQTSMASRGRMPQVTVEAPGEEMALRSTLGCDGGAGSSNAHYTAQWRVAYMSSSLGVVAHSCDSADKVRRRLFHSGHGAPRSVLCASWTRSLMASAEQGSGESGSPVVHIWNALTGELVHSIIVDWSAVAGAAVASPPLPLSAVLAMDFSPDGTKLGLVMDDAHHSVAVLATGDRWLTHEWSAWSAGSKQPTHFLKWRNNGLFVTGGEGFSTFWTDACEARKGLFHNCPLDTLLSCAVVDCFVLMGTKKGSVYVFEENQAVDVLPLSDGTVTSLRALSSGGFVYGTKLGIVGICRRSSPTSSSSSSSSSQFVQVRRFDLGEEVLRSLSSKGESLGSIHVCSVDLHENVGSAASVDASPSSAHSTMLVATRGGDLLEFRFSASAYQVKDAAVLTHGHLGAVRGLACHPTRPNEFATSGDDRTVRVWNALSGRQVAQARLPQASCCLAYSPDGSLLAVGLGSAPEELEVLGEESLSGGSSNHGAACHQRRRSWETIDPTATTRSSCAGMARSTTRSSCAEGSSGLAVFKGLGLKETVLLRLGAWEGSVTSLQFSPSGKQLAVGTSAGEVLVLDSTGADFPLQQTISVPAGAATSPEEEGPDSPPLLSILGIDWSQKSDLLRVSRGPGSAAAYFLASTGCAVTSDAMVLSSSWMTESWPGAAALSAASADPSAEPVCVCCVDPSRRLLAVAGASGAIRLFSYPAKAKGQECKLARGRALGASSCAFSANASWLVALGGRGRSILVFALMRPKAP